MIRERRIQQNAMAMGGMVIPEDPGTFSWSVEAIAPDRLTAKMYLNSPDSIYIDWGDGSGTETVTDPTNSVSIPTHTYASEGIYTISIHGEATTMSIVPESAGDDMATPVSIDSVVGSMLIVDYTAFLKNCPVTSYPDYFLEYLDPLSRVYHTFYRSGVTHGSILRSEDNPWGEWSQWTDVFYGSELTTYDPYFLGNMINAPSGCYTNLYYGCPLTSIEKTVWGYNPTNSYMYMTFYQGDLSGGINSNIMDGFIWDGSNITMRGVFGTTNCPEWPTGAFDRMPEPYNVYGMFRDNPQTQGSADPLWTMWPNTRFTGKCFLSCTGLDNYDDIPDDWK